MICSNISWHTALWSVQCAVRPAPQLSCTAAVFVLPIIPAIIPLHLLLLAASGSLKALKPEDEMPPVTGGRFASFSVTVSTNLSNISVYSSTLSYFSTAECPCCLN